jgi:PAS domain S-box-containing protein
LLAFGVCYALAILLALQFRTEPEKFAIFWPPNGLLLGVLVSCGRCHRVLATAVAGMTGLTVNLLIGDPLGVSVGFAVVNVGEACLLAVVLNRLRVTDLSTPHRVILLFVASLVVCAGTAVPGAAVVVLGLGAPEFWPTWFAFWMSDAVGNVLVCPLVVAWLTARRWSADEFRPLRVVEAIALFAGLMAVAAGIFAPPHAEQQYLLSFPFPLFPFLLWAAMRFGVRGTALALAGLSLLAVWCTGHGGGPFASPTAAVTQRMLWVQAFLGVTSLGVLTTAAAIAERRRTLAALRASEERYRLVTDTIREVFWVASADLKTIEYVSPAYAAVWGRSCESLYADPSHHLRSIHPDDLERVAALCGPTADPRAEFEYRIVRPDGEVRWIAAQRFPVVDDDGAVGRLVGISQDVTDRKEAELARERVIGQLQQAMAEIKTLRGLIPVCAWCHQVRDDDGFWQQFEGYIRARTEAEFTHCICPGCLKKQMADLKAIC